MMFCMKMDNYHIKMTPAPPLPHYRLEYINMQIFSISQAVLMCVNKGASNVHVTLLFVECWTDFHSPGSSGLLKSDFQSRIKVRKQNQIQTRLDSVLLQPSTAEGTQIFSNGGGRLNFHLSVCLCRFLRERRACSRSPVCRATQTIASVWAPAGAARIRVRNFAGR